MSAWTKGRLLAAGLVALAAGPAPAQFVDVPTFHAASATFASSLQEVDLAPTPDGGFVLVWGEFAAKLGSTNRIATRRFSRAGVPAAPPVRIDTSGYGLYPTIVADDAGGFVAAWDWSKEGTARALYSRRLDAQGRGIGSEQRVDTPATGPMIQDALTWLPSGPLHVWKQNGFFFRPYDRTGAPLSAAVKFAAMASAFDLDVDTLPDGGFVVTWTSSWLEHRSWARLYGPDREPRGEAFPIDHDGSVDEVAVGPGGEIAFVGRLYDEAGGEIWLRRFTADGEPLGGREMVRRVEGAGIYLMADAAWDSRGNLWVVWREYESGVGPRPPRGRAYRADGSPLGPDMAISHMPGHEVQTIALADDCFANAWYASPFLYANVVCLCESDRSGCGDGILDAGCEACDDGNLIDGDGCDSNCTVTACGNGIVSGDEECDDGNLVDDDGCDSNCTFTACGNGIVTAGEQCDDGNLVDDDGCDANCRRSGCGNGVVSGDEECDDGNLVDGDGCDANCTVSRCGNGIRAGAEQCDDGNLVDGDGCDSNCTVSGCGNGIRAGSEECDDGNRKSGDGCDSNCLVEECGNGRVEGLEQCDPGDGRDLEDPESHDAPAGGEGDLLGIGDPNCNPDCTLREAHDSVVVAGKPISVPLPAGREAFPRVVPVQVRNADVKPVRESPGHPMRLVAHDGDCPEGTVTGQPDFEPGTPGVQDTVVVAGGQPATALAEVTVRRDTFAPFDSRTPERCTLRFTVEDPGGTSVDPTPDNNSVAVELNVTDAGVPANKVDDEFFVESMNPVTIRIPRGQSVVTRQIKPVVRRSKMPPGTPDLEVTISASDGDCPRGTVGFVDFDRRRAGNQDRLMLRRGRRAKGQLGLVVTADAFHSPSEEAPRRCTILLTATGAGDTDPSNNVTRLVLDVIDRNDF